MKAKSIYLLVMVLFLMSPRLALAGAGLSTHWGEVVIQNIQIGQTHSVQKASNMLFEITNTGDREANIQVDVVPPSGEPKEGYESIPDTKWVTLDQNRFLVKPGEKAQTDVKIAIPNDKKYSGKKYQVYLFAYTLEPQGFMGVGLKSRLLLQIAPTKTVIPGQEKESPKANLNFKIEPDELNLQDIEIGKKYSLEELTGNTFKLTNLEDKEYTYQIKSIKPEQSLIKSPAGYENCPNPSFLKFKKSKLSVPAKGTEKIETHLKFPNKEKYRNKKYIFVIYSEIVGQKTPMGVYNRILVTTK